MKTCSILYLLFIFAVLHLFPLSKPLFCLAIDSISLNQKVVDGQTIVSSRGVFELGFFSPNGSKNVRYVGMWLKEFPNEKILWVANRIRPVTDTSGVLMIGADGNLIIADGANNTIWSSNVTNLATNHTSVATLSDGGNLVLKSNGQTFWESFNHPTDSLLPGMKFGINKRTGEQIVVFSWKNGGDPSPGNCVAMVDPQDLPQVLVMNSTAKLWRTGQWTGRDFIGIPDVIKDNRVGIDLNQDYQQGTIYFTYDSSDRSIPVMYINYTGDVILMQKDEKNQWPRLTIGPREVCDFYNTCGSFGTCFNNNGVSPMCKCLTGYQPKSMDEWTRGNWTNGCIRRSKLRCETNTSTQTEYEKSDGFFRSAGMKLPDSAHSVIAEDLNECKSICLKNCSCLACSYVVGIGCMLWRQDLIDVSELPSGGQELHIRLAYSELGHRNSKVKIIVVVIVVSTILVVSSLWLITCIWRTRKRGKIILQNEHKYILNDVIGHGGSSEVPFFSLQSIEAATDKFSETNKLGEGGFGPVYKGRLSDGRDIAVKRLSRSSGQGAEEFKNEVTLISKLQHRSLVKLLGFCIHGEERMLVYEYMPNKSLDKLIFGSGSTEKEVPDWNLRYKIIEGIARGLLYLHRDSRLKIVHRDLKVSNILLDEHMNPKISDFGMARIFQGDQSTANTNRVVGTYGYMSPEYALQGIFSEKSDVFSFGVMLLEIVSGKRNNGFYHPENPQNLLGYAWQFWKESNAFELLDPRLHISCNVAQVNRCIHVALLCVQQHAKDRPTMSAVLFMLQNEKSLPSPEQPAFSLNERVDATYSSLPRSFPDSRNDMTITTIDGR